MLPRYHPFFGEKANTLQADNGALPYQTTESFIRYAPKGNASSAGYALVSALPTLSGIPFCRFADFIIT